jgi:hypothetical protein
MAKATSLSSGVIETTSKCIILAFVFKCTVSSERSKHNELAGSCPIYL